MPAEAPPNWRQQTVADLAANPESWVHLGELFAGVEALIPPHLAFRRVTRINSDTDVGLHTARWRMFLSHVRPLVERQQDAVGKVLQRSEMVRLKPDPDPCVDCGGVRYKSHWAAANQKPRYTCLTCNPVQVPPKLTLVPVSVPTPMPLPKPKRRRHTPAPLRLVSPPAPQQLPKPKPIRPVKVKPEPVRVVQVNVPVYTMTSIEQLWDLYKNVIQDRIPSFQDKPKLRRMLYRALEAGAYDQHKRMLHFKTSELLSFTTMAVAKQIWFNRAFTWMNKTFTPTVRARWEASLAEAYGFGSFYILEMTKNDLLEIIYEEMERLRTELEPTPKQKPVKQRWGSPVKAARNMVSKWFMR